MVELRCDPGWVEERLAESFEYRGGPLGDSDNVTVENVEASGANKAGIRFGSSYNSVSNISLPGWGRPRSVSNLIAGKAPGYTFSSLNLGENNKVLNSNTHNNRVAGVQFSYQKIGRAHV